MLATGWPLGGGAGDDSVLSRLEGSGPSNLPMGVRVLVNRELLGAPFCLTELLGQNGKAVWGAGVLSWHEAARPSGIENDVDSGA